jgi:hypothetical protein
MIHPEDARSRNPRIQCDACGRWSRLHLKNGRQFSYGGCGVTGGDHCAAGSSQDICEKCCRLKCKEGMAGPRPPDEPGYTLYAKLNHNRFGDHYVWCYRRKAGA